MKNGLKLSDHTHICYPLSSACKIKFWGEVICFTAESEDTITEKLVTVECDIVSTVKQYQEMCVGYCELFGWESREESKKAVGCTGSHEYSG